MNQTTMSHIFLVFLTFGRYEDTVHRPLRSFGTKEEAESYMSGQRHLISYNMGLMEAVQRLMSDTWDKQHKEPTYPDNSTDQERDSYYEARNSYHDARRAELDRLLSLVGWKEDLNTHWEEEYDLYIKEIPFGFEVVKETTSEDEMRQAAE